MNSLLKSLFIVIFPIFSIVVAVDSFWYMYNYGITPKHGLHLLTAGVVVFFFSRIYIKPIPRTSFTLTVYTFLIFFSFIFSSLADNLYGDYRFRCSSYNTILTIGWILYLVWYSFVKSKNPAMNLSVNVGDVFPELDFETDKEKPVSSIDFKGFPTIYLFYRGNWCPFCMAQIKEMTANHEILDEKNIQTVFISMQPHQYSEKLKQKYNSNFHFLVDLNGTASKKLNIFSKNGLPFGFQLFGFKSDTVFPTIIITDSDQKIIYTNQVDNYRVRPKPKALLSIIDTHA